MLLCWGILHFLVLSGLLCQFFLLFVWFERGHCISKTWSRRYMEHGGTKQLSKTWSRRYMELGGTKQLSVQVGAGNILYNWVRWAGYEMNQKTCGNRR
eukprot:g1842.t1